MANNKSLNFPVKTFFIFTLLAVGLVGGLYSVSQNSDYRQHASEAIDINSANEITSTNNPDGTMGPANAKDNFSNTISKDSVGNLSIKINSSSSAGVSQYGYSPTGYGPTGYGPKGNQGEKGKEKDKEKGNSKGDSGNVTVKSLTITVSKAEVHLAQLIPPVNLNKIPTGIVGQVPVVGNNSNGNPNKVTGADKWETLTFDDQVKTIDLMDLSKTNAATTLGLTSLASGRYTEIRLYVSSATAVLDNNQVVTLTIPGKSNVVRIVRPFTISTNQTTTITLNFNPQKSVIQAGTAYFLKPVVAKMDVQ